MPSHPDGSHGSHEHTPAKTVAAIRARTPGLGKARKRTGLRALRKATTPTKTSTKIFDAIEKRVKLGGRVAGAVAKANVKALGKAAGTALLTVGGALQLGAQKGVDLQNKLLPTNQKAFAPRNKTFVDPRTIAARKRFARARAAREAGRQARKKAKSVPTAKVNRPEA